MNKEHIVKAIELAIFKVKPDMDETSLNAAMAETNRWLVDQPGFVLRRHGVGDGGERVDYVEWQSMDHAMAAAGHFMEAAETRAFMSAIEAGSVSIRHFELMP